MAVQVDQPWCDDEAVRIDDLAAGGPDMIVPRQDILDDVPSQHNVGGPIKV